MRGGEAPARIKKYNIYIYIWRPKKMYKLPERGGGGGGEVIWAMPERKHSFLKEVFPFISSDNHIIIKIIPKIYLLLKKLYSISRGEHDLAPLTYNKFFRLRVVVVVTIFCRHNIFQSWHIIKKVSVI